MHQFDACTLPPLYDYESVVVDHFIDAFESAASSDLVYLYKSYFCSTTHALALCTHALCEVTNCVTLVDIRHLRAGRGRSDTVNIASSERAFSELRI